MDEVDSMEKKDVEVESSSSGHSECVSASPMETIRKLTLDDEFLLTDTDTGLLEIQSSEPDLEMCSEYISTPHEADLTMNFESSQMRMAINERLWQ